MNKEIWESFKAGETAINCTTEEQSKKFIEYCYKEGLKWSLAESSETYWIIAKEKTCYGYSLEYLDYGVPRDYEDEQTTVKTYKELMEVEMKTLIFKEVIANIKVGQEYKAVGSYNIETVTRDSDGIRISHCNCTKGVTVLDNFRFELVQKPISFMEAVNSKNLIKHETWGDFHSLEDTIMLINGLSEIKLKELINGKWYAEEM